MLFKKQSVNIYFSIQNFSLFTFNVINWYYWVEFTIFVIYYSKILKILSFRGFLRIVDCIVDLSQCPLSQYCSASHIPEPHNSTILLTHLYQLYTYSHRVYFFTCCKSHSCYFCFKKTTLLFLSIFSAFSIFVLSFSSSRQKNIFSLLCDVSLLIKAKSFYLNTALLSFLKDIFSS